MCTPGKARTKRCEIETTRKQNNPILEQRRSQLQKQAAALRDCLIDYEFSSPAGARLECRTTWFIGQKQHGSKIHSALEQRSSQLQKQFPQNVSSHTRAVENIFA